MKDSYKNSKVHILITFFPGGIRFKNWNFELKIDLSNECKSTIAATTPAPRRSYLACLIPISTIIVLVKKTEPIGYIHIHVNSLAFGLELKH